MARFDVYRNNGDHVNTVPFLLDVQSEVLSSLDTRIVIPLRIRDSLPLIQYPANLMPEALVENVLCVLETPKLAAVPVRILKQPLASLNAKHFEITAALDFLFQGF